MDTKLQADTPIAKQELNLTLVCEGKETTKNFTAATADQLVDQIVAFVNE